MTNNYHYPELNSTHTFSCFGVKEGQLTREFFKPDQLKSSSAKHNWLWVDELLPTESAAAILDGVHSPHEYSGYDLHVRKQPIISKFADHDHVIIPDLDPERPGDQTLSMIVYTDFIWTRRSERIADLDNLFSSTDFAQRALQHDSSVYAFVGILRVMLDSLNKQLLKNERRTYAMEDLFLQRERGERPEFERNQDESTNPLLDLRDLSDSRKLVELRIHIAWLRKQFDAFERVVNSLFDPTQGAFHQASGTELVSEAKPYLQHLSDQIERALTKIEHLRDIHLSLDQLLVAEQAEKTNQTLLRLTWLSIIFMPAVVIAGIFGMNISLFGESHIFGIDSEIAVSLLLVTVGAAGVFYRYESRRHVK